MAARHVLYVCMMHAGIGERGDPLARMWVHACAAHAHAHARHECASARWRMRMSMCTSVNMRMSTRMSTAIMRACTIDSVWARMRRRLRKHMPSRATSGTYRMRVRLRLRLHAAGAPLLASVRRYAHVHKPYPVCKCMRACKYGPAQLRMRVSVRAHGATPWGQSVYARTDWHAYT